MSHAPDANIPGDDAIQALREALRASPNNTALRLHFADTLLSHGHAEEAEKEFREGLGHSPNSLPMKLGLARAFFQQGKQSHALVILEDLVKQPNPPARAFLLHAKLLVGIGEIEQAVSEYKRAVQLDKNLADTEFAARLGIGANEPDSEVVEGKVRATWGEEEDAPLAQEIERPKITFNDVGGMEKVKEEIRLKIIHPLTHADLYKAYGKPIGGGILLYGPPGCGKTYLARATAGEIKAAFISVGINDVLDMWIGNSERNLHSLFEQARDHKPCVLFFDEVDALGASRNDMRSHAGRQLINQFLSEMDGVKTSNEGVLILAATNAPWHLDSAFRRPGRFDRVLFVPPPDAIARAGILRLQCKGKPVEEIDYEHLAKKTDNFSGADLKAVVDVAIERKLQEAFKAGIPKPLTNKDLSAAVGALKPTTKEWFSTARNYALYSNQGGIYDDILQYPETRVNPNLERALLLFQQSRHEQAEKELRQALAVEPHEPYAHALLALCLAGREKFDEATAEARQAIHLAPDFPFAHYAHAHVLYDRNHYQEARVAIEEAIRLDPSDADYFSLLATIHFEERRWPEALNAAEQGLQFDPEHVGCTNLRAMAMVKLGRKAEAGATIDAALAKNPDNAVTHANQGWTLLEKGDSKKALEHFREALRLDPTSEWARHGIVEALKARNIVYAMMLKYFLWMSKLSRQAQWGIILGGYFGSRLLGGLSRSNPDIAPWVLPLQILYVAFVVLTWTAQPMFNLMLRLNRFGRLALTPEQTVASNWVGVIFFLALISFGGCLVMGFNSPWLMSLAVFGLMVMPVSGLFRCAVGWPRWTMVAAVAVLTLIGLLTIALMWRAYQGNDQYLKATADNAFELLGVFAIGVLGSSFLANFLMTQRPRR